MKIPPISAFKVAAALAGLYAGAVAWENHATLQGAPADTLHLHHMQEQLDEYREGDYKQGLSLYPWFNNAAREWRKIVIHGPFGLWDELHNVSITIGQFIKAVTSEEGLFAMGCAYFVFGNKMFKPFLALGGGLWKRILAPAGAQLAKLLANPGLLNGVGKGITWLFTTKAGLITTAAAVLFYNRFDNVYSGKSSYVRFQHGDSVTDSQAEAYGGEGG